MTKLIINKYLGTKGRTFWLVKANNHGGNTFYGYISVGQVHLPKKYIGKRIRLKIEVVDEGV